MGIDQLKLVEKFYGELKPPFPYVVFDSSIPGFKKGQEALSMPFSLIIIKQYHQYKILKDNKFEYATTIEKAPAECKRLSDGIARNELMQAVEEDKYMKLIYHSLFLSLINFEPAILDVSGGVLASIIKARQSKGGFTVKYIIKEVERSLTVDGPSYSLDIDIQDLDDAEADKVLAYVDINSPQNIIEKFEAYRQIYNHA